MNEFTKDANQFLIQLCKEILRAESLARSQRPKDPKQHIFIEALIMRKNKVSVTMIKEDGGSHHKPHIHVKHTDKINASISIEDFSVLAGKIENSSLKELTKVLKPKQDKLLKIWAALGTSNNGSEVHGMISQLGF